MRPAAFPPEVVNEYARCFSDPGTIHATCEDYRAGASIDLVHDDADFDNKVTFPMFALWSATGYVGRTQDVLAVWSEYATNVRGTVVALRPLHSRGDAGRVLRHHQVLPAGVRKMTTEDAENTERFIRKLCVLRGLCGE